MADAKTKILDKYENLEFEGSGTLETASYSSELEQKDRLIVNKETHGVQLNPAAQSLKPKTSTFDNKVFHSTAIKETLNQNFYEKHQTKEFNFNQPVQSDRNDVKMSKTYTVNNPVYMKGPDVQCKDYNNNNNTDAVSAIVKSLRKPNPDIKKFGGDPLEFRKFVRQFTAKIIANSDSDDENMNYLEQFTYGEAGKVVQGFSHINDQHDFRAAIKQLEERYGDTEVIVNAFIKKALDWQHVKPGDPKALDNFSLFLIECKNTANSIDAMQILEYSENIKQLMCKLPYYLHDRWRNMVLRTKTNKQLIKFEHFVKFVEDEAKTVNDLTYGSSAL